MSPAVADPPVRPGVDVSVVIPTCRREREVVEAAASALSQASVTVEVLVLDDSEDGSAQRSVESLHDPRLRYQRRPVPSRGRPSVVRNDGIAAAHGRFVHCLDDDDLLADGALAALVRALDDNPRAGCALGVVAPFGADPGVLARERAYFARAAERLRGCRGRFDALACLLFKEAPIINSACMIRTALARAIGGYDERVTHCEDADFYARAIRATDFVFVDRPIVNYRTGAPSRIDDPRNAHSVALAYRDIHGSYREAHGWAELRALQLLARTID